MARKDEGEESVGGVLGAWLMINSYLRVISLDFTEFRPYSHG